MIRLSQIISSYNVDDLLDLIERIEIEDSFLPSIGPIKAGFLYIITAIVRPNKILELGTLHGYSSLVMLKACIDLGIKTRLITIERNKRRAEKALKNFEKAKVSNMVSMIVDDAISYLKSMKEKDFDFIFIDIDKRQYPEAFSLCIPLLKRHGVMIFDNALMPRVKNFVKTVLKDERVLASLIRIEDGMLLCLKR